MLNWLGKIMPYFIVMKFVKKFGSDFLHCNELGKCRGWRIGNGEWIIWSQQNYDRMRENELKRDEEEKEYKEQEEKEEFERLNKKYSTNVKDASQGGNNG